VRERFIRVTGKPSIDHQKFAVGEWRVRDEFKVNVGLGVDSPDYKQAKASMLLQVFQQFNAMMSGGVLPNLLPKCYEAFRDQVAALGSDPDTALMTREEFGQFYQNLLQQQQMASEQQKQDPTGQLNMQMLQAQVQQLQSLAQESAAKASKAEADALKSQAEAERARVETMIAIQQLQGGMIGDATTVI
jgi:hypothetical protein